VRRVAGVNHTHVRAFLPRKELRTTRFICVVCDQECDPTREAWTSLEYCHERIGMLRAWQAGREGREKEREPQAT
jgi:hypothetical protein